MLHTKHKQTFSKMASKSTVIIICICLAFILFISSEAAARDSTADSTSKGSVETNGRGGYNGINGYDGRGGYNRGRDGYKNGDRGGGRGRCRYGCCRRDYYGCRKCCSYAGEAVETAKP